MLVLVRFFVFHFARSRIDFAAYNGVYPLLLTFAMEIYHSEHYTVIGYGKRIHPEFFRPLDQIFYLPRSVEQTVFRMNMQMRKSHLPPLSLYGK